MQTHVLLDMGFLFTFLIQAHVFRVSVRNLNLAIDIDTMGSSAQEQQVSVSAQECGYLPSFTSVVPRETSSIA
ncbi:hypothetical protein [Kerstersia gyiorum]|uniref:hypothetical protein n=1 Tax=Kerstersia gyiorum TaxID=206506 RepID=UPI0030D005EC